MGITALPPGTTEPPEGVTEYYVCNHFEWIATNMTEGAACWWRKKHGDTAGRWYPGTFKLAWFYDGVIADVSVEGGSTVGLLLNMGDELILPEDHDTLKQWENRPR